MLTEVTRIWHLSSDSVQVLTDNKVKINAKSGSQVWSRKLGQEPEETVRRYRQDGNQVGT